jgi:hypothetical protein
MTERTDTNTPASPQRRTIDYIVELDGERARPKDMHRVTTSLAQYTLRSSRLLPLVYVRAREEQEQSLLETLAAIEGISYRKANEYRALTRKQTKTPYTGMEEHHE